MRYWRYTQENMQELDARGPLVHTKPGNVPRYKRYLDEGKGVPLRSVWDDIGPVQGASEGTSWLPDAEAAYTA